MYIVYSIYINRQIYNIYVYKMWEKNNLNKKKVIVWESLVSHAKITNFR